MKRTMYKNIAVLDARNVTAESAQTIYEIKNVAMMLVTPQSQRALAGVPMKNIATTSMLQDDVGLMQINGQGTLGGEMFEESGDVPCKRIVLQVNGQVIVEPSLKPETISKYICGGCVNGQIIASESQMLALYGTGVMLNGQAETTPDGYERRSGGDPLTAAEVNSWADGARKYMTKRVRVEEGVLAEVKARGMKIAGRLIVAQEEAELLSAVYEGDTSKCLFVPCGTRLIPKSLIIDRRSVLTLRGDLWVTGDVTLAADVTETMLAGIRSLHVQGKLFIPGVLVDALMEKVNEDVRWMPYEGKLVTNDEDLTIDTDLLEEYDEISLVNKAEMAIDSDVSADLLRRKIAMVYNDGEIRGDKKQLAVLRARFAGGGGGFKESGEKEAWEEEAMPDDLPEDVVVVGNCANLAIG